MKQWFINILLLHLLENNNSECDQDIWDVKKKGIINITVFTMYRPPCSNPYQYNIHLLQYLHSCSIDVTSCSILISDTNIDILKNDYVCKEYIIGETGSCIDLISIKSTFNLPDDILQLIIETDICGHFTITFQIIFQLEAN